MKKNTGNTADAVKAIVMPVCEEMGLCLWDVTFEKEGADWFLKVLAEKPGAEIDIDEVEALSRRIDPLIDAADPIEQSYYLEVGSPGLYRKLRLPGHFEKYIGSEVEVRLIRPDSEGNREIIGTLLSHSDGTITVKSGENEHTVTLSDTAFVRLNEK